MKLNENVKNEVEMAPIGESWKMLYELKSDKCFFTVSYRCISMPISSLNAFFNVVGFIRNCFDKSSIVTLSARCSSKYSCMR